MRLNESVVAHIVLLSVRVFSLVVQLDLFFLLQFLASGLTHLLTLHALVVSQI